MAMSYSTLTGDKTTAGSIKSWAMRSTVESETVVEEAEAWIYRRLRVREMQTVDTSQSLAANAESLALPSRYLGTVTFMLTSPGRYRLHQMNVLDVERRRPYNSSGVLQVGLPTLFYTDATNMYFNVKSDRTYTTRHVYWQQPAALSASNETNFVTMKYPRLMRCACMMMASEFLKDYAAMERWEVKATREIAEIDIENDTNLSGFEPFAGTE